jgi:hypothetical protein
VTELRPLLYRELVYTYGDSIHLYRCDVCGEAINLSGGGIRAWVDEVDDEVMDLICRQCVRADSE